MCPKLPVLFVSFEFHHQVFIFCLSCWKLSSNTWCFSAVYSSLSEALKTDGKLWVHGLACQLSGFTEVYGRRLNCLPCCWYSWVISTGLVHWPKWYSFCLGSRARMDSKSGLHMFGEENREGDRFSSFIRSTITEPAVFGVAPHPAGHALCLWVWRLSSSFSPESKPPSEMQWVEDREGTNLPVHIGLCTVYGTSFSHSCFQSPSSLDTWDLLFSAC